MSDPLQTLNHGEVTKSIHCETPDAFLNALSRRSVFRGGIGPNSWIFRGHEDDERYHLIPSALRAEDEFRNLTHQPIEPIQTNWEQHFAEWCLLKEFFEGADAIGLPLPEDSQALRHFFANPPQRGPKGGGLFGPPPPYEPDIWPPTEILSLMALAQHHHLPTRLLDWTRHPLKAALFAATGASKMSDKTGNLSVWAFSLEMHLLAGFSFSFLPKPILPFTIITAPGATNSNLRAQEGVFTLAQPVKSDESPIDRTAFDQIIKKWDLETNRRGPANQWFRHITLPKSQAINLCLELESEGFNQTTLFPDLYGVVNSIKEARRL